MQELPLIYSKKSHAVVISTRIRLARNLEHFPFPEYATPPQREKVRFLLQQRIENLNTITGWKSYLIENLNKLEKQLLIERHLISPELAKQSSGSAVFINPVETLSFMINEEDHLRMQAILPGFQLQEALQQLLACDQELERGLEIAFDDHLGYLTACPTNLGTGIRASVMLHLPGLVLADQINGVMQAIGKMKFAVRGLYGEGSEAFGNLFQLSNQMTLGEKEEFIIESLQTLIEEIIYHELNARLVLMERNSSYLLDHIGRAYGILTQAHIMTTKEALTLLSLLKLGVHLKFFPSHWGERIDQLIITTQPAHLQQSTHFKKSTSAQRDALRATMIRKTLEMMKRPHLP